MMLAVSEIFYSLQGEGEFIGTPSVFVRLGGCNLRCEGFGVRGSLGSREFIGCDSIYAAHYAFAKEWRSFETSALLIKEIKSLGKHLFDIIITGGEPSLHFSNPILLQTMEYFLQKGHRICVESNGSVPFVFDSILKQLYFTLSVKLSNSGEPISKRLKIPVIQSIIDNAKNVVFKFVLNATMCQEAKALQEIKALLASLRLKGNQIFLMPQGTTPHELDTNIQAIYPLCLQEGFCLSDRLHIRIWGDKRGF
ncbi:6-pyruvoyl tetrahydropterin synthase [Helicobacter sp. 12S02634-8]|uniref:7-carboxy-7-deazaguanine synthase QueE n=1 Tax=Helicobacter sp. 12S02634-8 TaxID=1476199 RepID=UPI000BD4B7D2|nr:7-carboxy-7-deazaguanine synthase QueE [Helicobacter sp. 12S02634-8]PAF46661.1 6-pyruvoyl tetrahydropterin synthase [Helicobacter sp. 12S02634-8]